MVNWKFETSELKLGFCQIHRVQFHQHSVPRYLMKERTVTNYPNECYLTQSQFCAQTTINIKCLRVADSNEMCLKASPPTVTRTTLVSLSNSYHHEIGRKLGRFEIVFITMTVIIVCVFVVIV